MLAAMCATRVSAVQLLCSHLGQGLSLPACVVAVPVEFAVTAGHSGTPILSMVPACRYTWPRLGFWCA